MSADAVPFLKVSWRLLLCPLLAPGENPRSSDRAMTTLLCRSLLEDAALELSSGGSLLVAWRCCGTLVSELRCSSSARPTSCSALSVLVEAALALHAGLRAYLVGPWWWSARRWHPMRVRRGLFGVRVRWLLRNWLSSGSLG